MKCDIVNWSNKVVGEHIFHDSLWDFVEHKAAKVLHKAVRWQTAKNRAGTHSVKGMSEVHGTTRKMYRQKGTGRARHGSYKANIFVGGGISMGPIDRSHEFKMNKKERKRALSYSLSLKISDNAIRIIDNLDCDSCKTSNFAKNLLQLGLDNKKVLFIDHSFSDNLRLASKNLHKVNLLPSAACNVLDILKHDTIILTVGAMKEIEGRVSK